MPYDITCTNCSRALRVPDDGVGKHVKCPQCQTVLVAPKPGTGNTTIAQGTADLWRMKGADGQTYGPVPRGELDQWCREGRLVASTQILRDGASVWQSAAEIYPHLTQGASSVGGPHVASAANPFGNVAPQPGYAQYGGQVSPYNPGGYVANSHLSDKSKIAAGLLGIFIGDFGVHRFYLGDVGLGIVQIVVTLVTCGIGGLWGKIEGIMILCGAIDRDALGRKLRD